MISLKEKSMADPLLKVDHVTISYNGEPTVQDVSFELKQGEILGIVGGSGSGKSTIIKAIMGLLGEEGLVTKGDIWYLGESLRDMSEKKLRRYLGSEIGMVFQDCKAALCPVRKIGVQIHEAVSAHEKISKKETRIRAGEIMKKIGMDDYERVLDSYPFELSGGMQQRVGIAAAMLLNPKILMADEPTSALDPELTGEVLKVIKSLADLHIAMVIVKHEMAFAKDISHRVIFMADGLIVEEGAPEKVFASDNERTKSFLGRYGKIL